MKTRPLVTLLTDFGRRDPYAAAMKGVVRSLCPEADVVDLSHEIAPQDVLEAALFLAAAIPYFPQDSVHCVVVDPGVGTARRAIAARIAGQSFVCPDNGVLTLLVERHHDAATTVHAIENPDFMLAGVSKTFHGRDVFAPASARIAGGASLTEAGSEVADPVRIELPVPVCEAERAVGEVIHVDRFGNCITNIPRSALRDAPPQAASISAGARSGIPIHAAYGGTAPGTVLALFGSTDLLEIAVNQGNAAEALGLSRGTKAEVNW